MSTHKLMATLPHGDPDLGAEIECQITFSYTRGAPPIIYPADNADPGWPDEIEFVSAAPYCNGKPSPFLDYADMQQATLDDLARDWLESEYGVSEAMATVAADDDEARERAAELKADR